MRHTEGFEGDRTHPFLTHLKVKYVLEQNHPLLSGAASEEEAKLVDRRFKVVKVKTIDTLYSHPNIILIIIIIYIIICRCSF